jgi:hypothetical protein
MTDKVEDKTDGTALLATAAERTNDLLAQIMEQNALTRAEVAKSKAAPAEAERTWTRDELQQLVDSEQITVGQMIDQLQIQGEKRVAAKLTAQFEQKLADERQRGSVEQRLAAYRADFPELMDKTSELRKAAEAEFAELVSDGHSPDDLRTELLAVKVVVKHREKAGKEKPREQTSKRQRSVETPGSRGERSETKSGSTKWPSWMEDYRVDYYEEAIRKGRYPKGMDDPMLKKELEILEKRKKNAA